MRIAVMREQGQGERRVALIPDHVDRLVKGGHQVAIEQGAGEAAGFYDSDYRSAGATVTSGREAVEVADVVLCVQPPTADQMKLIPSGSLLVGLLQPATSGELFQSLAGDGVNALAMELVPRTTRAQAVDALSSQSSLAGYKAVLLGASALPRILPMLTTAAGTLIPAKVFVIGAGVAGLQAIATARRLGGVVSGFDVRPVVKEQVESLGATFVEIEEVSAEGQGGYAAELDQSGQERVLAAIAAHIKDMDLVITTAQIPGKRAPLLITADMVASMRPGSVIVDLAAETGGNCELTQPGETLLDHGVTVMGTRGLAATVPIHASQAYGRNLIALLGELTSEDGSLVVDPQNEIVGPMLVAHDGKVMR